MWARDIRSAGNAGARATSRVQRMPGDIDELHYDVDVRIQGATSSLLLRPGRTSCQRKM
jgi:hypothetical protein